VFVDVLAGAEVVDVGVEKVAVRVEEIQRDDSQRTSVPIAGTNACVRKN
jgi:hypothetical protein